MLAIYLSTIDTQEDKDKFTELYRQYRSLMLYIAYHILNNSEDAEDAVHSTCVLLIKHLEKINKIDCPQTKSLIVIMVKSVSVNLIRRKNRFFAYSIDDERFAFLMPVLGDCNIEKQTEQSFVMAKIQELPETQRTVLLLRHNYGYTLKEISDIIGCSIELTKKLHQRAKKQLEDILEEQSKKGKQNEVQ